MKSTGWPIAWAAKWLLALSVTLPVPGHAQDYPSKAIRFVTNTPGGTGDFVSRVIGQAISPSLGQPVLVDNRSALLGIELVSQARPDGYTFLVTANVLWLLPLMQKVSYDPVRDFSPVALAISTPNVVAVHPSLPVKSIRELMAFARSRPGEINFAGGSPGSASRLAGEMFKVAADLNLVYVPYKGTGPALNDTIGGRVHLLFSTLPAVEPHVKSGRLRALAITSAQPSMLAPKLPTVASAGLPGYESEAIFAVFAPAGTPPAIVQRLNQEVTRALQRSEIRQRFMDAGSEVVSGTPSDLAVRVAAETKRMGKVIASSGIRLE